MEYRIPPESSTTGAVVEALCRYEDTDYFSLPPLADSIPPDALDELFEGKDDRSVVRLSFTHVGYVVTVENGETVRVESEGAVSAD